MGVYVKFVIVIVIVALIIYLIATVNFKEAISFDFLDVFKIPRPVATNTTTIKGGPVGVEVRQPETPPTEKPKPTPPAGFTVEQLSPYYQKVKINGVNIGYSFGSVSSVGITTSNPDEPVAVTGWHVNSNKGVVLTIPQGVPDYNQRGILSPQKIILNSGDYLNIYSSVSPIGLNFRLNKCTGYLNNNLSFNPELPRSCPGFDRNEIAGLSGSCQSFIYSLGGCRQPTGSEANAYALEVSCRDFLDTVSYWGCYERHRADADFFSREWRAWVGNAFSVFGLDRQHDRLMLFDQNNLLVDLYIY